MAYALLRSHGSIRMIAPFFLYMHHFCYAFATILFMWVPIHMYMFVSMRIYLHSIVLSCLTYCYVFVYVSQSRVMYPHCPLLPCAILMHIRTLCLYSSFEYKPFRFDSFLLLVNAWCLFWSLFCAPTIVYTYIWLDYPFCIFFPHTCPLCMSTVIHPYLYLTVIRHFNWFNELTCVVLMWRC